MIQMAYLRQWREYRPAARLASASSPSGCFGELSISTRVSGVSAASRRSRSSVHPCALNAERHAGYARADRIFGISTRFGHNGVYDDDAIAPAATSASTDSINADIPDAVNRESFSGAVGRCRRVT